MNIINEFFVSFILIKLYFKFKVCRKIKFPLLWKFYFSKWKFYFSADNNLQNFQKNDFFTLPEKCLQYFHLAMIHLCFMVLNPLNFKDSNRHLDKAINYLIDGTFEIYELIFKEYFLLFPKDEELKDELKKIKNLEFKILMQEVSRVKLLNHYKEFCEEIFYNIELEKII